MISSDYNFINPRQGNCLYFNGPVVYTRTFSETKEPSIESCSISRLGDKSGKKYTQTIDKNSKRILKEDKITQYGKPTYKNIQCISNDYYSSTRLIDETVIGGYVIEKTNNKPLKGFKGFLENIAWHIGNKSNGCERKGLNKIAGKIINKLRACV